MRVTWIKWVLGIVAALVTAGVATASGTLMDHGERLTRTEVHYQNLKEGQRRIEQKQDALDQKLDKTFQHLLQRP